MKTSAHPNQPRGWLPWLVIGGSGLLYMAVGAWLLSWVPGALLQNWIPAGTVEERDKLLGSAAQVVLFGLGGVIATVGVTLSVARHRQELVAEARERERLSDDRARESQRRTEADEQRRFDSEREMRSRFVTAVDLLSTDLPIKRTAALYALGALADDWSAHGRHDEVQVCIDVICGYLRAPLPEGTSRTALNEVAVKTTGFNVIRAHLAPQASTPWCGRLINLSGAHIDFPVSMRGINITSGTLVLTGVTLVDESLSLREATFSDGARVSISNMSISGRGTLELQRATIQDAELSANGLTFSRDARVYIGEAEVKGDGIVWLDGAVILDPNSVVIDGVEVTETEFISPLGGAMIGKRGFVQLPDGRMFTPSNGVDNGGGGEKQDIYAWAPSRRERA